MNEKKLIYLASPYSHEIASFREGRFQEACQAAGRLMEAGFFVFSPIAMTHPICVKCKHPFGFEFYKEFDHLMIDRCDALVILQIDGWSSSVGIAAETEYARKTKKDVYYLDPDEIHLFAEKAGRNLLWNKQSV
jgi:nucleoside 2-deoxyribosyltransferase